MYAYRFVLVKCKCINCAQSINARAQQGTFWCYFAWEWRECRYRSFQLKCFIFENNWICVRCVYPLKKSFTLRLAMMPQRKHRSSMYDIRKSRSSARCTTCMFYFLPPSSPGGSQLCVWYVKIFQSNRMQSSIKDAGMLASGSLGTAFHISWTTKCQTWRYRCESECSL